MSYLKEALEMAKERAPLREYGYSRHASPMGSDDKRSHSPEPSKSIREFLTPGEYVVVKAINDGEEDLMDHPKIYDKLFSYLYHDMPHGTATGKDGDPHQWIIENLHAYL